jgi:hypothetical protein
MHCCVLLLPGPLGLPLDTESASAIPPKGPRKSAMIENKDVNSCAEGLWLTWRWERPHNTVANFPALREAPLMNSHDNRAKLPSCEANSSYLLLNYLYIVSIFLSFSHRSGPCEILFVQIWTQMFFSFMRVSRVWTPFPSCCSVDALCLAWPSNFAICVFASTSSTSDSQSSRCFVYSIVYSRI